jgi:hypothetical protein
MPDLAGATIHLPAPGVRFPAKTVGHFRITNGGRVVMHNGEPVLDRVPTIQAINAYVRII